MTDFPRPSFAAKRKSMRSQMIQQIEMFDRLADPLLQVTGKKNRIKWANQAAHDLFGAGLINHRLGEVFISKDLKAALKSMRSGKVSQSDHFVNALSFPNQEFRVRLVRLEKKTFYGARVLVAFTDVTEVLRLQAQRADFVANASHELKTPITSLSGFIETLEHDPKALATFLPLMSREAERMRALIHDLLSLTKTEMEPNRPPTQWFDPQSLIDQAVSGLNNIIEQRHQELNIQRPDRPCFVRGDGTELVTVFTNLLQNASKYAPNGSRIEIVSEIQDSQIFIHFINEGKGIAAKHIPRLTERFYRVDDGRARKEGGTGLGLAIVKHILIRHRGHLHITSQPNKGARFTVSLPCSREAPQSPAGSVTKTAFFPHPPQDP